MGRLDKLTSGIVLVAKTPEIHAALQRGKLEKDYLALVYGRSIPARGAIDLRLARDGSDRRRVAASESVGAPSVTHFERLARVPAPHVGLGLLRCRLVTGGLIKSVSISLPAAGRSWAIRCTGSRCGHKPRIDSCARHWCPFRGKRCTPGDLGCGIR